MYHHRNGSAIRTRHSHTPSCHYLVRRRVRTKLQEACAAEGVGARQADGLVEGLEADGAIWHCRSVWISAGGEAGSACSSSTAAEAWHGSWIAGTRNRQESRWNTAGHPALAAKGPPPKNRRPPR
jgi:hypothetical protein